MQGLKLDLVYDPDDPLANTVDFPEKYIEEIAEFCAERGFFGGIKRTQLDENGEEAEPEPTMPGEEELEQMILAVFKRGKALRTIQYFAPELARFILARATGWREPK